MLENFLQQRIKALESENSRLREREITLTTYLYELLDRNTPVEYRDVIKQDVFGNQDWQDKF